MQKLTVICLMILVSSNAKSQQLSPPNKTKDQLLICPSSPASFISNTNVAFQKFSSVKSPLIHHTPVVREIRLLADTTRKTKRSREDRSPSKFYVKLYSGYGIFTPGSFRVNSSYPQHDTTVKVETKKGLGHGFRFGGGFGLVINDFLNIGIDAEYQAVSWTENFQNVHTDDANFSEKSSGLNYTTLSLTPHVIFKALAKPKYYVYNKLGLLLMLPFTLGTSEVSNYGISENLENNVVFFENVNSTTTEKYKISLGVGLNVALGINMKLSDKFRFFGELFGNYSALSPQSSVKLNIDQRSASLSSPNINPIATVIKQTSKVTTETTFEKGESLSVNPKYTVKPPYTDILGYTVTEVEITTAAHQFPINMAVLGINAGITFRF